MTLTFKASIAAALAVTLAAGAAFAQPAPGGGRGAALKAACGADIEKFCPNMGPSPELKACVRKNYRSLSQTCQTFLSQMRSQRQQQGQGEGAPQ